MSRFVILVAAALLLRGALESRDSETETRLGLDSGSAPAASPPADAEPEGGSDEDSAAADEQESGSEEDADSAAPDESESGSQEEEESQEEEAVPCTFDEKRHAPRILEEMLKKSYGILEFPGELGKEDIKCTSLSISQDDACCTLLQDVGTKLDQKRIEEAVSKDDAYSEDWCKVDKFVKWAVDNKGKVMHERCTKHSDCKNGGQTAWLARWAAALGKSRINAGSAPKVVGDLESAKECRAGIR